MRETLAKIFFSLIVSFIFLLGILLLLTPVYTIYANSFKQSIIGLSVVGAALVVLAILLVARQRYGIEEITFRDNTYSIGSANADRNGQELIYDFLEENPSIIEDFDIDIQEIRTYSLGEIFTYLSSKSNQDPLQRTIDELSKQIAVIEYLEERESEEGLRIVQVDMENESLIVSSDTELSLVEGLIFNVFAPTTDSDEAMERVATAILTESQSTEGNLFEFEINSWKNDDPQWIGRVETRLESDYGRVKIIREGIIDGDKEDLQVALDCIQQMKNIRDRKYEY